MRELRVEILRLLRLGTWEGIDEAIKLLVQNTGKGSYIDPCMQITENLLKE